ncbi:MAG: DUF3105 domain-containing protein [Rhizomicrobium sp.]
MTPRKGFALALSACAAAVAFAALGACGSDDEAAGAGAPPPSKDASSDRTVAAPHPVEKVPDAAVDAVAPPVEAGPFDAGPCNARIEAVPVVASPHVPEGTPVVYTSNPPSSGPHYDTWANFQELTHEVDDRHLVHSLEHGAVLLLYKCDGAECDAIVPALRAVRDAVPADPLCDPAVRTRVILAPRAANDVPVAAAAWGHTYRADCVDAVSLASFIQDHYGKGTEDLCIPGQVF